jgi:SAM-dependent methyltransferase
MSRGGPEVTDLGGVKAGFSEMAAEYDALAETHPMVIWLRNQIRGLVESHLQPGASILEINAGSGLDAAYFAGQGYRVHATDIAPGMLAALATKASEPTLEGRLTYEETSNTALSKVAGGPYDLILSNLGGLNCTRNLRAVTRHLPGLLKPGGVTVLVVMPPVCPWELALVLKGNRRVGLRRLQRGGTVANVGGAQVPVWYHSAGRMAKALGPRFEMIGLRSFNTFSPPSYFDGFVRRHPSATSRLMRVDERIGGWPVLRGIGDFYALVSRLA